MDNDLTEYGIHALTLRTKDGREQRTLAWFPTDAVRQDFYDKAARRGLEIIINNEISTTKQKKQ